MRENLQHLSFFPVIYPPLFPPPPPFRSLLIPHRPPSIIMSFICTCTFYNERKWDIPDPMSPKSDTHYVPESDTHTDLGVACCDVLSLETGVLLNSVGKIVQHIFFSWILTLGLLFCSWRPGRFRVWQAASHWPGKGRGSGPSAIPWEERG